MSGKKYVLDGAMVECNCGVKPAKLLVNQNRKVKIQGKFKATDMDVQVPETFGQCKLKPTSGGYLPCIPALQKWMKTTKTSTLGGSKKFLFEDSETMCATGGKVTIVKDMQINSAGSVKEEFKEIAMTIPGAMMGNDKAPKVVEKYWMDESKEKRVNEIQYGETATIFVRTENVEAGESITIKVKDTADQKIDGQKTNLTFSGTVLEDGTAELQPVNTQKDWNKA
ncbi:DUF4280 domain-containing protein [Sungkyunkwania multivorans]|uniref:DUF4280 domain-containing protein n=1 Tax=Sungkyunkwania multivorans TaxID=1173618 RepID=A0ABW3D552_9FLAO